MPGNSRASTCPGVKAPSTYKFAQGSLTADVMRPTAQLVPVALMTDRIRGYLDRYPEPLPSPYRRSIWADTDAYNSNLFNRRDRAVISQMMSVVAAKHQVKIPGFEVCLQIFKAIQLVPSDPDRVDRSSLTKSLEHFLHQVPNWPGIGIPTALCLLAVLKEGRFAPHDKKFVHGLKALRIISEEEASTLLKKGGVVKVVDVYVNKVLPHWWLISRERGPQNTDNLVGSACDS
ncbi:hypothetical protein DUGA6_35170 [Duganella sp. HH105]|nr:hypothetical protein DUGA6_35170 [Duganella sp. HH105]